MMAWMNEEALRLTLETGVVHYWSRSRAALWKKGETSGAVQEVIEGAIRSIETGTVVELPKPA